MDEIVKQALAKWPNVPACTGWLGLDARGQWWMRDDATQARGSFQAGCAAGDRGMKGSLLQHEKLIAFIQRNYGVDAQGYAWFQNGPQRVFVELEAAPYCLRLHEDGRITATAGQHQHQGGEQAIATISSAWLDENGHLYLAFPQMTATALGRVHSQDMLLALAAIENGQLPPPQEGSLAALQQRFAYCLSPEAAGAA
ncbi:MAG: DUF2946 family protein [Brachymonas sp.]|jgi:hypothetical protein